MKSDRRGARGYGCVFWMMVALGCMDRAPAPVCPVPIEVATTSAATARFDGVDLLVVVDNSVSMDAEQQILSTGFFTLINSLVKPVADWPYPAVENMRVAIVSSDMGLQYGPTRETASSPSGYGSCVTNGFRGDDGRFLNQPKAVSTPVEDGVIRCDAAGEQCPPGFACRGGFCMSETANGVVACDRELPDFAETARGREQPSLAAQVACLARQGTEGCAFEQQLEASVRALEREEQKRFLSESHLLAVLMVSDEEDCSIKDPALFQTAEWSDSTFVNMVCNRTEAHEQNLFDVSRYRDELVAAKSGQQDAVIFAAIVGVPTEGDVCQGTGAELRERGCLDNADMQIREVFVDNSYYHFAPACTRLDGLGVEVTKAFPGRRFVKVAESFGDNGYVYSICNKDWSPAMEKIADIIASQIAPTCYPKKLDWEKLSQAEQAAYSGCEDCGWAKCEVVLGRIIAAGSEETPVCPEALYAGLSDAEKKRYEDMITISSYEQAGIVQGTKLVCPVPKLPAALSCDVAREQAASLYSQRAGWYYCENTNGDEGGANTCADGLDNNQDGRSDCEDSTCQSCSLCGGDDIDCREGCRFGVSLTKTAQDLSARFSVKVQCLQRFTMTDENCVEEGPSICNDDQDNDGNGLWDCDDTLYDPGAINPHMAEPACCPMTVVDGRCQPLMPEVRENCGQSPKLRSHSDDFWLNPANARLVDACKAQKEALDCEW